MIRLASALCVLAVLGLGGCASGVAVGGHWHDPSFRQKPTHVLVVGISERGIYRRLYEDELQKRLQARGVRAEQSYLRVPGDDLKREQLEAAVKGTDFDAVMVTHLVDIEQRRKYYEGPSGAKPVVTGAGYGYYGVPYYAPYYGGLYPYYSVSYSYSHSAGYYQTSRTYNLETALYVLGETEGQSEQLVWALMTEAVDPKEIMELIGKLADLTIESLVEDGLL